MKNKEEQLNRLKEIVYFLGESWRVDVRPSEDSHYKLIRGKYKLLVNFDGWKAAEKNRIFFRGAWGQKRSRHYREPGPSISVSKDRSNKAIAGDIGKRLLPAYYNACKAIEETTTENVLIPELKQIEHLFKQVGLPGTSKSQMRKTYGFRWGDYPGINGKIEFYRTNDIEVSVHRLSPEQAIQLSYFIKNNFC